MAPRAGHASGSSAAAPPPGDGLVTVQVDAARRRHRPPGCVRRSPSSRLRSPRRPGVRAMDRMPRAGTYGASTRPWCDDRRRCLLAPAVARPSPATGIGRRRRAVVDRDRPRPSAVPAVARGAGAAAGRRSATAGRAQGQLPEQALVRLGLQRAPASRHGPRHPGARRGVRSRRAVAEAAGDGTAEVAAAAAGDGVAGTCPAPGPRRPGSCRSGDSAMCPRAEV